MQEVIPILISKDDGRGNFLKAEQAQIEKVGQEVANTLTCHEPGFSVHHSNMCIVVMRGRNPENPSDRTPGIHTEQRLEPNSEGICNTLTTVQKDNLVLEQETIKIKLVEKNNFYEQAIKTAEENNAQEGDIVDAFNHKVLKEGISPTVTTRPEGKKTAILPVVEKYRIRKLTPKECWRLMGFNDEDFEKAAMVNSNSQLYKQAGNSIVKNVLMAIFSKMVVEE